MLSNASLKKTGSGWEFASEEILEDFLYEHLEILLSLNVLDRQYIVNSQRCDILAVDSHKKLVVLELKNVEDRGIVQQLTRYYDALLDEKPFSDKVDYQQPVRLVAITPSFHRDNFTDRKYHTLDFQFLEFSVIQDEDKFYLYLKDVDNEEISKVIIPYQELENDLDIPVPPKALLKVVNNLDGQQQEEIFRVRRKILSFNPKIQEFASAGSIKYGSGSGKSSKFCAEFFLEKGELILFLWIPYKGGESSRIGRAIIWTNWQDKALIEGYVSSGVETEINRYKRSIKRLIEAIEIGGYFSQFILGRHICSLPIKRSITDKYIKEVNRIIKYPKHPKPLTREDIELFQYHKNLYEARTGQELQTEVLDAYKSLDSLVDLALQKWLERI
ncbi:endonuclease NucS domain-containing protein [Dapis sp. BLCC M172]|uniref:endonuclease NucS domain-containing protein n=1 Tax=Dapis sp. BLCC M172 TaxID=2975281 RepID=UPI003CE6AE73